jgi:uncharacterized protein (DUF2267 family)
MAGRGIEAFESSRQKTDLWLKEIARELRTPHKPRAYSALRAVLHTLRDCMPVEAAAKFSGQMPLILKGVFFDGWKPHAKPERLTRAQFYARVRERLRGVAVDGGLATRAVLVVLDRHLSPGEVEGVKRVLPHEVRLLWRAVDQEPDAEPETAPETPETEPVDRSERSRPELSGPGAGAAPIWP